MRASFSPARPRRFSSTRCGSWSAIRPAPEYIRYVSRGALALAALACCVGASGQSKPATQTDIVCAHTADAALRTEPQVFARIFSGDAWNGWLVADRTILHRIQVDPDIYSEVAKAWFVDDRVGIVAIETRSLEFRANASYCYRATGSLARVTETSSGGNTIDDETRYLDTSGHVVQRESHFSNIYPRPGETMSPDLRPSTPSLYLTVRQLPFYELITATAP